MGAEVRERRRRRWAELPAFDSQTVLEADRTHILSGRPRNFSMHENMEVSNR